MTPSLSWSDALARYSPDLMIVIDREGRVTWASESSHELLGADPTGALVCDFVHPEDESELLARAGELLATDRHTVRISHRVRHHDGSWRMFETSARNLMREPGVRGVLLQARDITAATQLGAMMAESTEAAYDLASVREQLIEQLHALDQCKARLSAALVHDLKTPLTVILLSSKYIVEDLAEPALVTEHATAIERSADAMHRMVLDLLDVGRSEDGQLVAKLADVDLRGVLAELAERAAPLLKSRGQTLAITGEVGTIRVDEELMIRAVQNLLDNCCKYAPMRSEISISLELADHDVVLAVADRGPGIPDEAKQTVFELYARLERDTKQHTRTSRGVGLAFCKLALAAHAGQIWVEDREGGGSVFRCRWPAR
ncbi:MAG: PAS domain-containing sensor histidine kinase [Kofleriaceae bacterium]